MKIHLSLVEKDYLINRNKSGVSGKFKAFICQHELLPRLVLTHTNNWEKEWREKSTYLSGSGSESLLVTRQLGSTLDHAAIPICDGGF